MPLSHVLCVPVLLPPAPPPFEECRGGTPGKGACMRERALQAGRLLGPAEQPAGLKHMATQLLMPKASIPLAMSMPLTVSVGAWCPCPHDLSRSLPPTCPFACLHGHVSHAMGGAFGLCAGYTTIVLPPVRPQILTRAHGHPYPWTRPSGSALAGGRTHAPIHAAHACCAWQTPLPATAGRRSRNASTRSGWGQARRTRVAHCRRWPTEHNGALSPLARGTQQALKLDACIRPRWW
jgi:hypothetical protein